MKEINWSKRDYPLPLYLASLAYFRLRVSQPKVR